MTTVCEFGGVAASRGANGLASSGLDRVVTATAFCLAPEIGVGLMLRRALLLCAGMGLLLFIMGCATLSAEQCKQAAATGWEPIGDRDGRAGYASDELIERHASSCSQVNIVPDRPSYQQGWAKGNATYCTPDFAYTLGFTGDTFRSGVCSGDVSFALDRYRQGRHIYYCSPGHAYKLGRAGESFNSGSCTGNVQAALDRYHEGLREKIRSLDDEIRSLRRTSWGPPKSKEARRAESELAMLEAERNRLQNKLWCTLC
jgi:hypothetical protein